MQDQKRELQELYKEDWRQCEQILPFRNGIMDFVGEMDADLQWSKDEIGAYKSFVKTGAYSRFTKNDYPVLGGKTGTGKSSILRGYTYAINSGKNNHISLALILDTNRFYKQLKQFTDDFEKKKNEHLEACIENCIELIIKLCVMQKLVQVIPEADVEIHEELQQISKCLERKHIISETDIVKKLSNELDYLRVPGVHLGTAVTNLVRAYGDINSLKNHHALKTVLDRHRVLVILCSPDYYDITERSLVIMNKVLIEMAFSYNETHVKENILLKAVVPSEVATEVIEQLPGKKKSRVIIIKWNNKDLIRMLAGKIFYFFSTKRYSYAENFIRNYQMEDFRDDKKAIEFLHKMLPERCPTPISANMNTILYCIMHTQKKPRQILTIFNLFIEKICEEEQFDYFITHSDEIFYYIRRAQGDIISDALTVYNVITDGKILPVLQSVLTHKKNVMDEDEFTDIIRDVLELMQSTKLTEKDVRRFLIESGLVGQLYKENYTRAKSDMYEDEYVIKISSVFFEYQIESTLPVMDGGKYVLHPMCYAYYGSHMDHNMLVYPEPLEDKDIINLKSDIF